MISEDAVYLVNYCCSLFLLKTIEKLKIFVYFSAPAAATEAAPQKAAPPAVEKEIIGK